MQPAANLCTRPEQGAVRNGGHSLLLSAWHLLLAAVCSNELKKRLCMLSLCFCGVQEYLLHRRPCQGLHRWAASRTLITFLPSALLAGATSTPYVALPAALLSDHAAAADYPFLTEEQIKEAKSKSQNGKGQTGADDSQQKGHAKGHSQDAHLGNAY